MNKSKSTDIGIGFVLAAVILVMSGSTTMAGETEANAGQTSRNITLVYETTHNPPRALGQGTAIDWDKPGLTLELLRLVGDSLGIEFTFRRMPWKRGLNLIENNRADGIFHASYKEARERFGVYPKIENKVDESRSIFLQSYVLYKLKDSPLGIREGKITEANGDIGVINNYSIAGELKKNGYKVQEANTLEVNFNKLGKGRIAAFATLENMADDYLARNGDKYSNIVKVQPALKTKPYYLLLTIFS